MSTVLGSNICWHLLVEGGRLAKFPIEPPVLRSYSVCGSLNKDYQFILALYKTAVSTGFHAITFSMVETSKLNTTFSALGMDQLFVKQAGRLDLYTPADIMSANLALLKTNPEFSYTWYAEMLELLDRLELLREFQKNQL